MKAGITDVAAKAGSVATVPRSFARPDLVSPKTRQRVLQRRLMNELLQYLDRPG